MIDYATFQRIQHLHRVDQLTVAQIAHAIALDARTVRRWLDEPRFRPRLSGARPSKLDPYKAYIRRLLKHHPYSAAQILNRLREAGYVGGATIVKDYLQRVRPVRAPRLPHLALRPRRVRPGRLGSPSPRRCTSPGAPTCSNSNSPSPTSHSTTRPEDLAMTRRKSRPDLDTFHAHLDALKLSFIREHYPDVVRRAAEEQSDHLSVLERLIEGEANLRRDRSIERRIRLARFPVKKTLDSFDWSWPNKINRLQVQNLFRLRFLDDATNVVLVGGVGLGKSHLVTALGLQACERGHSVLFTSAIDAVNTLAAAKAAGHAEHRILIEPGPKLRRDLVDELHRLVDVRRHRTNYHLHGFSLKVPRRLSHCPLPSNTVSPARKRGVTVSARKRCHSSSVTTLPAASASPKKSRNSVTGISPFGHSPTASAEPLAANARHTNGTRSFDKTFIATSRFWGYRSG